MIKFHLILISCNKLIIVHKRKSKKDLLKKFMSKRMVISFLAILLIMIMIRIMLNSKVLLMPPLIKEVLKIKESNPLMPTTVSIVNYNHLMNSHQISPSILKREKEVKEVKCLLLMAKIMTQKLNTITKLSM